MSLALHSAFARMCRVSTRFIATPSLSNNFLASMDGPGKSVGLKSSSEIVKIRRPLSPFAVFIQSQYSRLKRENPSSKATDVMKLASGLYAELPPDEKNRLVETALNDRQRYEADMKRLTDEQRTELVALSQKKRHSRAIKQRRRHWRATGRPVRPLNAPLLFMKERWGDRGVTKVTDFVRDLMSEWRALPDEHKQKYRAIEAAAKRKFDEEFAEWQAKQALEEPANKPAKKSVKKRLKAAGKKTKKVVASSKNDFQTD